VIRVLGTIIPKHNRFTAVAGTSEAAEVAVEVVGTLGDVSILPPRLRNGIINPEARVLREVDMVLLEMRGRWALLGGITSKILYLSRQMSLGERSDQT
jgi:hypothetical protein